MSFDDLFGLLILLYVLSSIVGGLLRGRGSEGRGPGQPEVLDMDELERRLRERRARQETVKPAAQPAAEAPRPAPAPAPAPRPAPAPAPMASTEAPESRPAASTVLPAAPTVAPSAAPSARPLAAPTAKPAAPTVRRSLAPVGSTLRGAVQLSRPKTPDDDWGVDMSDLDWDAVAAQEEIPRRRARRLRSATPAPKPRPLPAAIRYYLEHAEPWQAAVVLAEVLGPPRALAPYRVWPRG